MMLLTLLLLCVLKNISCDPTSRPHIIFIIADDLGWNDVGFHGSGQIPTPNIDALAYSGLILNNYYVTPLCTPSRSALMTGKYPIHTGMQHGVLYGAEPRGLPLSEKLLPQYLKELGYATHMVGKWHLGCYKKEYTPLYRGFDSHTGYWTGHHDYFDHTAVEYPGWGLDMRRGMDIAYDLHGQYSTDIFTKGAEKIISNHNTSQPLFLYIAHTAVHSANPYDPLPAPDDYVAKFKYINPYSRQKFAGVLSKLDESVGKVVEALSQQKMLENSIIVFTTDNGGAAEGFNLNAASNWPLRGVKNTLWEGGVRGAGLLWSPFLLQPQRVALQNMHLTDWLPTLYFAAGGDVRNLKQTDGVNLWTALSEDKPSERTEVLHNIDDLFGNAALTVKDWKIVKGTTYNGQWDNWYGPSGRNDTYDVNLTTSCLAGTALKSIGRAADLQKIVALRNQSEVNCYANKTNTENGKEILCKPLKQPCLFNIREDPCEKINLAAEHPHRLKELSDRLTWWNKTAIPPGNLPIDPRGDPKFWDYTWTNFGDFSVISNIVS